MLELKHNLDYEEIIIEHSTQKYYDMSLAVYK